MIGLPPRLPLDTRIDQYSPAMEILVIHRSITQRRVFLNCLRKTGYGDVQAFEDEQQALAALNGSPARVTIIEKELLAARGSSPNNRRKKTLLERSRHVLVISYQFTEHEVTQLLETADELLLMPFTPELLEEKVGELYN